MLSDYRTKFGLVLLVVSMLLMSWICYPADVGHSQTASSDSTSLKVVSHSIGMKSDGKHITGQIKNISNRTFSNVKVLTSFYDQNNRFLGSGDFTYLEPPTMNPGETGKFDLMISPSSQELGAAKLYTLTFVWQNQDGSSSYFVANSEAKKPEPPLEQKTSDPFAKKDDPIQVEKPSNEKSFKFKYIGTIGSEGSGEGKLSSPASIEYASANNKIYVSDLGNNRIQIFDNQGHFISSWGMTGKGAGQFDIPGDVTIDSDGNNVYVSDIDNNRVQKFDTNGTFLTEWGSFGTQDGQFNHPGDISIDTSGKFLYITDVENNRVQKFDINGKFIMKWGTTGNGPGQFLNPTGITTGDHGEVYVADTKNDRVLKYNSEGNFVEKWDSFGKDGGKLARPDGITFDSALNLVFVSDRNNGRILVYTEDGKPLHQLDLEASTNGLKIKPRDIALDESGKLFVVDKTNNKIHVFTTR